MKAQNIVLVHTANICGEASLNMIDFLKLPNIDHVDDDEDIIAEICFICFQASKGHEAFAIFAACT